MPRPPCPVCGKPVAPRPENRSAPFCSDRCRLVDLGRWLGEEYRIPGPRAGDGADPPGPAPRGAGAPGAGAPRPAPEEDDR